MKKILSIVLIAISVQLFAQQAGPNISWDTDKHDFGTLKEEEGKVTHKFRFTNTGSEPLVITHVKPSCGCTSSDYTKSPILPGGKGYVSATFNPARRPGKFSKTITVTSNSTPPTSIVRFTGTVTPKPKTKADLYPRKIGELNVKTNHLAFSRITNADIKVDSVPVANLGSETLHFEFKNVPKHIKITPVPEVLAPGQTGYFEVEYNAALKNDWGFVMDKIIVATNNNSSTKNRLSISASITEDFASMTPEERAQAPKITFEEKTFNFGEINQGDKISHSFTFKNEGKSDLIIRKTKTSCGCTVLKLANDVIKPGETSSFDVTFNSAGKSNRQNKSITIITNDPNNSQVSLRITGNVKVPQK